MAADRAAEIADYLRHSYHLPQPALRAELARRWPGLTREEFDDAAEAAIARCEVEMTDEALSFALRYAVMRVAYPDVPAVALQDTVIRTLRSGSFGKPQDADFEDVMRSALRDVDNRLANDPACVEAARALFGSVS